MNDNSVSHFISFLNQIINLNFPISNNDHNSEYFPSNHTYVKALELWKKTKSGIGDIKYWGDWHLDVPNRFNSDHMIAYLYFLAREEAVLGRIESADRICSLNRIRGGIDLWHSVMLPSRFLFVHPIGTVLGRATYAEEFICYQNVTVGSSKGKYPIFKGSCLIYSGASILGDCLIGENVIVSAGSMLVDVEIPSNSKVFGSPENLKIKPFEKNFSERFFAR